MDHPELLYFLYLSVKVERCFEFLDLFEQAANHAMNLSPAICSSAIAFSFSDGYRFLKPLSKTVLDAIVLPLQESKQIRTSHRH